MSGNSFALIGVNSDVDREAILQVCHEKKINWRSFWNGPEGTEGPIAVDWNVRSWPSTFILDATGKIRFKDLHGQKLDQAIIELLAEIGENVEISHDDEDITGHR